jgi:UDP-N-acetylmuramoyl-L-alanyl-D-glutamate--2,6-diaminopimelate ligase
MKLKKLIQGIDFSCVKGSKEIDISGICSDSRRVSVNNLFIAKRGCDFDGNQYIPQAIESGASAVLTDHYNPFFSKITQLIHPQINPIEALLADRFYGHPSGDLAIFGVTGTNGKTTTTYLIKHLFDAMQYPCGLIGTVETIVGDRRSFSSSTTHGVIQNHKLLREMVNAQSSAVAFEVSSHGLMQNRVDQIDFDAALLTNLTPDHLDYHRTMPEYAAAKQKLFQMLSQSPKKKRTAIANSDNPWTLKILDGCTAPRLLFGCNETADVRAEKIEFLASGTRFIVRTRDQSCLFTTTLIGRFNVYNVLGAICVGLHAGFSLPDIAQALANFQTVPGRLERVINTRSIHVFVDYAHTGDALDNVLMTLGEIDHGKIITVFGAGGDRDPGRRPGLAQAAQKGSDISIVTSDNPRQEDPQEIARQILAGFSDLNNVHVELDRQKAIELAISIAHPEDIVLIAGKGHERTQIFAHHSVPFDDRLIASAMLAKGS